MFSIKIRVIVGAMIFLGHFMIFVVRYNIAVHILDMTSLKNEPGTVNYTVHLISSKWRVRHGSDRIHWNDMRITTLLSAYYIGYVICFPIFHNIGDRLGPTWVVGTAGMVSGILDCLSPMAAYTDFWLLFIVRTAHGFCAGAMQPNMVQVLRYWVPPIERNYFMWAYCGTTTGTFSTLMLCALVQYYSRWPVGFYVSGVCQVLWCMLWITIVTDHPRQHAYISKDELNYLINTIGNIFTIKLMNANAPWKLILRSVPFWALCILNFGYSWFLISLCLHGTLYYCRILQYRIYNAAILTAVPFLLRFILGTIAIQIYHWQNSKMKKILHIRKYFIVISHVVPAIVVCSTWFTPAIPGPYVLTIAAALTAAGMDLTFDLCYELSPNYVNSINTVIKMIGNMPGIISPYCVGAVTLEFESTPIVWKQVWCFHAMLLAVTGIIFLIWGETRVQPWNSISHRPRRPYRALPKPSIMSNISEMDEDDATSNRLSTSTPTRKSIFNHRGSFKLSMSKV